MVCLPTSPSPSPVHPLPALANAPAFPHPAWELVDRRTRLPRKAEQMDFLNESGVVFGTLSRWCVPDPHPSRFCQRRPKEGVWQWWRETQVDLHLLVPFPSRFCGRSVEGPSSSDFPPFDCLLCPPDGAC